VTLTWLLPMLSAALFGSLHCVGMCGGLIAVANDGATQARARINTQLGYHAARLCSYVTLGAVAGTLGQALDLAGKAAGLGKAAAILAGASMTLWGLWAMLEAAGARLRLRLPTVKLLPTVALRWLASAQQQRPVVRAALLGASSALLPCGFLYAFALAGAATGTALGGALVMASLWLGNLPALLGFGFVLTSALTRIKRHIPLLSAASVFALGLLTLNLRVNLPAFALSTVTARPAASSTASMPADCPFHKKHRQ
jgi:uncharacterized protein